MSTLLTLVGWAGARQQTAVASTKALLSTVVRRPAPSLGEKQEAGLRGRPAVADTDGLGDVSADFCRCGEALADRFLSRASTGGWRRLVRANAALLRPSARALASRRAA
jgi:hypothetical protein